MARRARHSDRLMDGLIDGLIDSAIGRPIDGVIERQRQQQMRKWLPADLLIPMKLFAIGMTGEL